MKVCDLHNDYLTSTYFDPDVELSRDVNYAIWGTRLNESEIIRKCEFANIRKITYSVEDISNVVDYQNEVFDNIFCVSLGYQNVGKIPVTQKRVLCGGCDDQYTGLTITGRVVAKYFSNKNVWIDLAHANEKTFFDVCDLTDKVIDTHTGFLSVCKHQRNISDAQIELIVQRKGYVGLCLCTDFLGGNKVDNIVANIDYFVSHWGIDNICLGTDFFGTDKLPIRISNYDNLSLLEDSLLSIGYKPEDVEKIFFKNYQNCYKVRFL